MKNRIAFIFPLSLILITWVLKSLEVILSIDLGFFGVKPRDISSLIGIITSPFIHGSWGHLISNTLPFFFLTFILFISYRSFAWAVFIFIFILTGLSVWLFARGGVYHIGASGVVYGLASFLFFMGVFRMEGKSIAVALSVALLYGGMVWGIFPTVPGVSWESHLFGGLVGGFVAYLFRKRELPIIPLEDSDTQKDFKSYVRDRSIE